MKYIVKYKRLRPYAKPPKKAQAGDSGYDLYASTVGINGNVLTIGSGIAFDFGEIPLVFAMSRSSCYRHGCLLSNGVGLIDGGYRGEVKGVFYVMSADADIYKPRDRFLQLVFPSLGKDDEVEFVEVFELSKTERGEGGYGSTGDL